MAQHSRLHVLNTIVAADLIPVFYNPDVETAKKIMAIIDKFEDDDDVQAVYHNLELTDEIANAL